MAQHGSRSLTFALKTAATPRPPPAALRAAVASLDRELPVFDLQTMEQRTEKSLAEPALAGDARPELRRVALLLSAVGIYGVLAYLVTQRKKEIGIRIALGSTARGIFQLVIREGRAGSWARASSLGATGAFVLRRTLERQLFGVSAADPLVVGTVASLLAVVALAASALPARRATRIDPVIVLTE